MTRESPVPLLKKTLPDRMRARLSASQRFLVLCVLCGLACGIVAVGFHLGIQYLFEFLYAKAKSFGPTHFPYVMVAAPALSGLVVGLAVHFFAPSAIGGGIPQTREAYYNKDGRIPFLTGVWRFVLGILFLGFGNSLGREGPIAHISASISSTLGRWGFRDKMRSRAMLPVGMAAGIAAAFNAPLAAITFVFEQLLDNFSMRALGGIVVAVVISAALARTLLGDDPIFAGHLDINYHISLWMLVALPLGVVAGVLGHVMVRSILALRAGLYRGRHLLPLWSQPAFGGLLCGLLGLGAIYLTASVQPDAPERARSSVFSVGYEALPPAFHNELLWQVLAILLVFKIVAVVFNFASGGTGGLFSPALFIGGMLGGLFGVGIIHFHQNVWALPNLPDPSYVVGGCVLLGMGAAFASIVRCPFTSLVILSELTGNYSLVVPLMAGNILSWAIAHRLGPINIYDSLLLQDGVTLKRMPDYRGPQDYRNLPVATIMTHDVVTVRASESVHEALARLETLKATHRSYPVVDEEGLLSGMLSLEELRSSSPEVKVGSLITEQTLVVAHPDTSIRDISNRMVARDLHHVAIISAQDNAKLLGIVTLNDIARQKFAEEGDA